VKIDFIFSLDIMGINRNVKKTFVMQNIIIVKQIKYLFKCKNIVIKIENNYSSQFS